MLQGVRAWCGARGEAESKLGGGPGRVKESVRAMSDEAGYVLFHCDWMRAPAPAAADVAGLIRWRERLHSLGLVGAYPDGIGFGNLSVRLPGPDHFLVSGTGTGRLDSLGPEHFTEVIACDVAGNRLRCRGPVQASSESLSHAAVYRTAPAAGAVIHVHHAALWERLRGTLPTTDAAAAAGTPEMAFALEALLGHGAPANAGLLVMGGHPEGLIAFGHTLDEAGERIVEALGEATENASPVRNVNGNRR